MDAGCPQLRCEFHHGHGADRQRMIDEPRTARPVATHSCNAPVTTVVRLFGPIPLSHNLFGHGASRRLTGKDSDVSKHVHITVHHRKEPDLRRLARALIDMAIRQSQEADETASQETDPPKGTK